MDTKIKDHIEALAPLAQRAASLDSAYRETHAGEFKRRYQLARRDYLLAVHRRLPEHLIGYGTPISEMESDAKKVLFFNTSRALADAVRDHWNSSDADFGFDGVQRFRAASR